jgi:hypothetical protein
MLNRAAKLAAAAAIALLALPAAAKQAINGFIAEPGENVASLAPYAPPVTQGTAGSPAAHAGFEYVGGETGWQPAGHKFVRVGGAFVHSEECDHAIRVVAGPTPGEIERAKRLSPGA